MGHISGTRFLFPQTVSEAQGRRWGTSPSGSTDRQGEGTGLVSRPLGSEVGGRLLTIIAHVQATASMGAQGLVSRGGGGKWKKPEEIFCESLSKG